MDREKIQLRIEELKKENDQANSELAQLDQRRDLVIREILVRNGRILELKEILKENNLGH